MSTESPSTAPTAASTNPQPRLVSLDALRGTIMLFMASAGFGIPQVARHFPDSGLWSFLSLHTSHVAWVGGGAWDMIQPAFMFMVGVALPFSIARRKEMGEVTALVNRNVSFGHPPKSLFFLSFLMCWLIAGGVEVKFGWMVAAVSGGKIGVTGAVISYLAWWFYLLMGHPIKRSFILVALAVFLASNFTRTTNFMFTNVLGQIGLGYTFLFLLHGRGWKVQLGAMAAIAVGVWTFFAMHPVPPAGFDFAKVGVKADELKDAVLLGFFAHWDKNTNAAAAFDQWFLNLFPRDEKFVFNAGGYQTLNFVPSLITMILGLLTGEMLRRNGTDRQRVAWMFAVGAACLALGLIAGWTVCPIIKRIWTPSWALFSGGIVLWVLAGYYWLVEMRGCKGAVFPLAIVGMNSIAIYLMDQLLPGWITGTLKTHLGQHIFDGAYGIVWQRCSVLAVLWLVCWWMYRRKIFLRI